MATFQLRPHDGGKDIVIPSGKTTIGRGPFLGVSDKRVSRSHAVLELTDGNLSVLPLHANPTFYKANVKEKFVSLKKNEAQDLVSGNTISLLPDALFFEIVYEGSLSKNGKLTTEEVKTSKDRTVHNIPSLVVDYEKPSAASKVPTESFLDEFMDNRPSLETGPTAANQKDTNESHDFPGTQAKPTVSIIKEHTVSPSKPQVKPASLLQKTRKLPSWLIQSTSSETKSPAKNVGNRNGKAPARSTGNITATPNKGGRTIQRAASLAQEKQTRSVSDEDFIAGDNDEEGRHLTQKGKTISKKRMSADMDESDDDITPAIHKKTKQTICESDDEDVPLRPTKNRTKPVLWDESSSGSEEDVKSGASKKREETKRSPDESTIPKLPVCPYGNKCYRKNPVHFKEYLHHDKDNKADNDNDDKAAGVSDEDDDDRPECPYGTSCYRSNLQHKQDFKHTEAPGSSKRKNSKHKSIHDNESDDNDSFFDDGDDAVGSGSSYSSGSDDSDWQLQGGDDEDVNELLTEARGFLRSKKMTKPV